MAIQFRRGNEADLVAEQLLPAEPAFSLDQKRFLIGTGDGVAAVPTEAQVVSIATSLMSQRLPVGTILPWPANTAPPHALLLQGQLVNRADYLDLWQFAQNSGNLVPDSVWSNCKGSFSTGNGSTTFRLPDYRGRVPVGYDSSQTEFNMFGKSGGNKTVALTVDQIPSHRHAINNFVLITSTGSDTGKYNMTTASNALVNIHYQDSGYPRYNDYAGGNQPFSILQPYAVVNYIIIAKAETTQGDIESALAELISQTQTARDSANQAANDARQMMDDIENMVTEGVAEAKGYTDAVAAGKVDKVAGKGLSTNDYTNTDKSKVDNLPANTNAELDSKADLYYVSTNLAALDTLKADKSALSETNLRVAEIGKDLSDYKAVLSQLNPNQEAKQTVSDYGAVSLPVNAANGHMDAVISGVTATNIIQNGNFANGTTGWTANSGTSNSVSNNTLSNTTLGYTNATGRVSQIINQTFNNQQIYISFKVRVNNSDCIHIQPYFALASGDVGYFKDQYNPTANTWYHVSDIKTITADTHRFIIGHYYNDMVAGRTMELQNVLMVNLTEMFGEGNEPTVEQCDKMFANWFDGTKSTPSAMRIVSESEDKSQRTELYIPDVGKLMSTDTVQDEISFNRQTGQWVHIKRVDDNGEALSNPTTTPINVSGTLLSYPKGTVYTEPVLPVAGIYTANGISVTNTDFPIESIERIYKIDFATGVETEINPSSAVVAGNRLSFTHPDLAEGDIVFFTYYHDVTGTNPKITVTYYDSRYTVKDSVNNKFYRWKITVANGVPSISVEEVS